MAGTVKKYLVLMNYKNLVIKARFLFDSILVGNEGFEPPMPDSESGALPLGEFPTAQVSVGNFGFLQVLKKTWTSTSPCCLF